MKVRKGLKKTCALALSCSMIISCFTGMGLGKTVQAANINYSTALVDGVTFYDANKCGSDADEDNAFSWRDDCHTHDGADVGLDLTGGYHDCGDHVKFGITQGYAASVLGWSYYEYKNGFDTAGATDKTLETLKYFCDYFMKCHPNMFTFYYQIGNGDVDHAYWGAPEDQEASQGNRPTYYKADASNPGTDVCSEAAAALSIMYLNYKSIDADYANKCLTYAKSIYALGKSNLGCSSGQSYYNSTSYKDDLAWAATWLYKITGESSYLSDAEANVLGSNGKPTETDWAMCWNDMWVPAEIELYKTTNNSKYLDAVKYNVSNFVNDRTTTSGGLKVFTDWGNLRYVAAESMIAMQYYSMTNDSTAKSMAAKQISYILGDNPNNMSYVVGYGSNYPQHPHHRAANGGTYNTNWTSVTKNVCTGYLVGGPGSSDSFTDDINQCQYTEGGIDYNAGFVGAVAALVSNGVVSHPSDSGSTVTSQTPATTETVVSSEAPATSETVVTSEAPQSSQPAVTTVAPTTETVVSSEAPTTSAAVTDTKGVVPSVKITTQAGSSISQAITVSSTGSKDIDLSKLVIRYKYSRSGNSAQSFWCDNAGLQLSVSPYYVNMASDVNATFGDGYVDISFGSSQTLATGAGSLNMGVRFAQADWSAYQGFVDNGYDVYYDGALVASY